MGVSTGAGASCAGSGGVGSGVGACVGTSSVIPVFYPSRTAHIVGAQKLAFLTGSGIIVVKKLPPTTFQTAE